jgi:hypothetical protein
VRWVSVNPGEVTQTRKHASPTVRAVKAPNGTVEHMDYTTLSLAEVRSALSAIAGDTEATFASLSTSQLNWRPDATRWSVAQCFEHLFTANRLMVHAAQAALEKPPSSVWQRVPGLPALLGRMLIRSQAPEGTRKFSAPAKAQPTTSDIPGDVLQRFVHQHHEAVEWLRTVNEHDASRAIMVSPFIKVVTYSVLDGCRLIVAHDRRHFEQARRVMQSAGFPGG